MATLDINTIDITDYQSTPLLTTEATLTLAVDLDKAKPADAPPHVEKAAKRMLGTVEQIKQEFVAGLEWRASISAPCWRWTR